MRVCEGGVRAKKHGYSHIRSIHTHTHTPHTHTYHTTVREVLQRCIHSDKTPRKHENHST